jgi:thymidylate synthase (FAD)
MEIKTYDEIDVSILSATKEPQKLVHMSLAITQHKAFEDNVKLSKNSIANVFKMNHTSVFEHVVYCFIIKGASRSFLAQITRHRMGSFTSGSQHYQDYSQYGVCISKKTKRPPTFIYALENAIASYNFLCAEGVPKKEARQVLPNAMQNNLIWTVNARSLSNFFNLRLCNRNTEEIQVVAIKILALVKNHFPELFNEVGADCFIDKCKQGKMCCGNPWKKEIPNA